MIRRFLRMMFADVAGTASPGVPANEGWEKRSLIRSVRRVVLLFAAMWQVAMALAAFSALGPAAWPLALAAAGISIVALVAFRMPRLDGVVPVAMAALGLGAYLASGDLDSVLVFTAAWQVNLSSFVAGLLILNPFAVPVVMATSLSVAGGILWMLPQWGAEFPVQVVVTQFAIIGALKWGGVKLVRAATDADTVAADLARAHRRQRLDEHTSAEMAEQSRVLHDTAINTLGAIANGGAGTADADQVREQCARDVAVLSALGGRHPLLQRADIMDVFTQPGLPTRRRGADDAQLERWGRALPEATVAGIVSCVREAVTNATKHSGADGVVVEAEADGSTLVVTVSDDGVGFVPEAHHSGSGIGLSILDRARDLGFDASVDSTPGRGTTVRIVVPDAPRPQPDAAVPARTADHALYARAGELWGLGVAVVSVILTVAGSADYAYALFPMIAIMLVSWFVYRTFPRVRSTPVFLVSLIVSTCAVFLLAATATTFGTDGAVHWHALAPTGPFVLLLTATQRRWARTAAVVAWAGTAVTLSVSLREVSTVAAAIVLVAAGVGVGFSGVWAVFQGVLRSLGDQAARSRHELDDARIRADLDAATQRNYRRWISAGLDSAIDLLRAIAERTLATQSPATCAACATEERHLRQIVQISPRFVNLSRELPQTLRIARAREVSLFLRTGDVDAPDIATARSIARSISASIAGLERGDTLRASLFPIAEGLQLTLLGHRITLDPEAAGTTLRKRIGSSELVEITYHRTDEGHRRHDRE